MNHIIFLLFISIKIAISKGLNYFNRSTPAKRLIQASNCSLYNDCFNCSASYAEGCAWETGKCIFNRNQGNSGIFVDYLMKCQDSQSKSTQSKYCGTVTISTSSSISLLADSNGVFGYQNLFCNWKINIEALSSNLNVNYALTGVSPSNFYRIYSPGIRIYVHDENWEEVAGNGLLNVYYINKSKKLFMNPLTITFNFDSTPSINAGPLFISISIIICFLLVIISCICKCVKNCREQQARRVYLEARNRDDPNSLNGFHLSDKSKEQESTNKEKLKQLFEHQLVEYVYKNQEGNICEICIICQDNFKDGDPNTVVNLHCNHVFHIRCIRDWFDKNLLHLFCPICNADIFENKVPDKNKVLHDQRI